MRTVAILLTLTLLAACGGTQEQGDGNGGPPPPPMPEAKADGPAAGTTAISLDAEGLRFIDRNSGRASLLAFGAPRAQAEEALARVAGKADDRSANAECGVGTLEFTRFDAMTLNFQDGKFVGWFLGDEPGAAAYSTASGVAIGTTRAGARQSVAIVDVADSSLGEEFRIGPGDTAMGGIFSAPGDQARIDALFAGVNCFFR